MPEKKDIILVGGGGHCRSCIDVIEESGEFSIAGIVEKPGQTPDDPVLGYDVIGNDNDVEDLKKTCDYALVTIGQIGLSTVRGTLFDRLKKLGFSLPAVISPTAYVSRHALVGEGSIVMHGAVVNAGARIGENVILNSCCLIEHDVEIGNHCHIATSAVVNGDARIGSGCFIGSGAVVVQGVDLPANSFCKAGSLVKNKKS